MTLEEFELSLNQTTPPAGISQLLEGLWHDARGNWAAAHAVAQDKEGTQAFDRLHAYLHRKEGDESNAGYWYRRAGAAVFKGSLEAEWNELVKQNLD